MSVTPLKLKLLNGFYRYLTGEQNNLPLFQGNDIPEFVSADTMRSLTGRDAVKTSTTREHNINDNLLSDFIKRLCYDKRLNVSGVGMMHNGELVALYHHRPYTDEYRHVSYSMCKSVTQMAIGIAYDEGLISLDEKLCDLFPEHSGIFLKKGMKDVSIEHLLTMRSGVKFDEVSSFFHMDWCKSFMGFDLSFAPGEEFTYNSLNTYMLAAVIKVKTGRNMLEYLQEKLFDVMDIHDITWDKCPKGIEKGGWGLKLSVIDMLKLGQLYIDNGRYKVNGKWIQLISEEWIELSTTAYTKFDDKKILAGYGYQIWTLKDGAYLFNGVFGQNVYINTSKKIVIATTASAYELFPDGRLVDIICEFVNNSNLFSRESFRMDVKNIFNNRKKINFRTTGFLYDYYNKADKSLLSRYIHKKKNCKAYQYIYEVLSPYQDVEYRFEAYATGLLPITTQAIYSNYHLGISGIKLTFEGMGMYIHIEDSGIVYRLKVGYGESIPYEYQLITMGGKELPIAVRGSIEYDEDYRMLLMIRIVYLEEVSNKILKIYFNDNEILLSAYETPNMMEFADKLVGEEKMRRTKLLGKLQAPDFIMYKLHKIFSANNVIGKSEV